MANGNGSTSRTCSEPGCDRPHAARGFCSTHYYRRKRSAAREERERRVQELQAEGLTYAQIGDELGIAESSVGKLLNPEIRARGLAKRNAKLRAGTASRRDRRERISREVDEQRRFDQSRGSMRAALGTRWEALLDAERAFAAGEEGAAEGLVGCLVDIASGAAEAAVEFEDGQAEKAAEAEREAEAYEREIAYFSSKPHREEPVAA